MRKKFKTKRLHLNDYLAHVENGGVLSQLEVLVGLGISGYVKAGQQ